MHLWNRVRGASGLRPHRVGPHTGLVFANSRSFRTAPVYKEGVPSTLAPRLSGLTRSPAYRARLSRCRAPRLRVRRGGRYSRGPPISIRACDFGVVDPKHVFRLAGYFPRPGIRPATSHGRGGDLTPHRGRVPRRPESRQVQGVVIGASAGGPPVRRPIEGARCCRRVIASRFPPHRPMSATSSCRSASFQKSGQESLQRFRPGAGGIGPSSTVTDARGTTSDRLTKGADCACARSRRSRRRSRPRRLRA